MRRSVLLVALLLAAIVTGCGGASPTAPSPVTEEVLEETAAPTPDSGVTAVASPTAAPQEGAATSTASPLPSDEAPCVPAVAEFPVEPNLPAVTPADHIRGGEDASITLIVYSDFQ